MQFILKAMLVNYSALHACCVFKCQVGFCAADGQQQSDARMAVGVPCRNALHKTVLSSTYLLFPSSFEHRVQRGHNPAKITSTT